MLNGLDTGLTWIIKGWRAVHIPGPLCTKTTPARAYASSGEGRSRKTKQGKVREFDKEVLNFMIIMVKNFIIKIITSLVKVQMLQQGVNTPLEKEVILLPFQEFPPPPPPPPPPEVWSWQHPAHTEWLGSLHVPGRVRAACPLASPLS